MLLVNNMIFNPQPRRDAKLDQHQGAIPESPSGMVSKHYVTSLSHGERDLWAGLKSPNFIHGHSVKQLNIDRCVEPSKGKRASIESVSIDCVTADIRFESVV